MGAAAWLARICGFLLLAGEAVWAIVVVVVAALSIMWGPPCTSGGFACGTGFWPGVGIALAGSAVVGLLLVIALPVAWRRPVALWICVAIAAVIGVVTALAGVELASR